LKDIKCVSICGRKRKILHKCFEGMVKLTAATRNAPFRFAQASQQAFVLRKGNHLYVMISVIIQNAQFSVNQCPE